MKVSRRLRYRLRTVIAVTAVIACCFSWLTNRANQNRKRRQAVEQIWRLGGSVGFVGERVFDRPTSESDWAIVESRGWFYDAIHTRTPKQVLFANYIGYPTTVDDTDIPELVGALKRLPEINRVRLDATDISRDGMEQMRTDLPNVTIGTPQLDFPSQANERQANEQPSNATQGRWSASPHGRSNAGSR
ncbi:hypothetical protein SH528x_007343 [Novipirellula sp. SH528]|uniref:hypothetical protein n=1 Tax=Novipirellula sp. SH528 TaxID=3454466 RepID=UPI003FA11CCB